MILLSRESARVTTSHRQLLLVCVKGLKAPNSMQDLFLRILVELLESSKFSDSIINTVLDITLLLTHSKDVQILSKVCTLLAHCSCQFLPNQTTFLSSVRYLLPFLSHAEVEIRQEASKAMGYCLSECIKDKTSSLFQSVGSILFEMMKNGNTALFLACGQSFLECYSLCMEDFSDDLLLYVQTQLLGLCKDRSIAGEVLIHFVCHGVLSRGIRRYDEVLTMFTQENSLLILLRHSLGFLKEMYSHFAAFQKETEFRTVSFSEEKECHNEVSSEEIICERVFCTVLEEFRLLLANHFLLPSDLQRELEETLVSLLLSSSERVQLFVYGVFAELPTISEVTKDKCLTLLNETSNTHLLCSLLPQFRPQALSYLFKSNLNESSWILLPSLISYMDDTQLVCVDSFIGTSILSPQNPVQILYVLQSIIVQRDRFPATVSLIIAFNVV